MGCGRYGAAEAGERRAGVAYRHTVARLILLLLAVWVALIVVGWVVKGLFWLAVIGLLFFLGTAMLSSSRRR